MPWQWDMHNYSRAIISNHIQVGSWISGLFWRVMGWEFDLDVEGRKGLWIIITITTIIIIIIIIIIIHNCSLSLMIDRQQKLWMKWKKSSEAQRISLWSGLRTLPNSIPVAHEPPKHRQHLDHLPFTLWWTNVAIENGHRNSGFSH